MNRSYQAAVGAELKRLRERQGMTQEEAGLALGVRPSRLSHWETGRNAIAVEQLNRIVEFYGLRLVVFLRDIDWTYSRPAARHGIETD